MFDGSIIDLRTWWPPIAAALGGLLVGVLLRQTVMRWIGKLAAKSSWKYDDVLVDALRNPVVIWSALLGLRLAVRLMPLNTDVDRTIGTIILVLGILSVSWAISRFVGGALRTGAQGGQFPAASLFASIARIITMTVGALIVLQTLGIPILSIVTALGIGGLAVGLALQDTLSNFFAGIRIIAARKLRPGDFVRLESGQEGFIEDINWGLTTVREPGNNLIIVPNAKLASAVIVNFSLPTIPQNIVVNMGVGYGSDLARVERIVLEVAAETLGAVPEAVADFKPAVRFKEFGESSINLFVVFQARAYTDRWSVISDFIKRIHPRLAQEGIEIPFPHRVVINKNPESRI